VGVRTFTTTYRLIKNHHISEIFSSSGESEFSLKRRPFGHFCSLPIKSSVKTSVLCNGSELHRSKKLLVVYSGEVRRVYRGMPCCCKIAHRVLREKRKVSDICKKSDICNPLPSAIGDIDRPVICDSKSSSSSSSIVTIPPTIREPENSLTTIERKN
jgi:hypothetical protein